MRYTNFCATCGARLNRKGWRSRLRGPLCEDCAARGGNSIRIRRLLGIALFGVATFTLGRSLRPPPPPLIIHRAANSPLTDLPIDLNRSETKSSRNPASSSATPIDETVYLCGARTQKGTPCRRRVHFAGERCYQHKGRQAMVSLEKLTIKP